MAGRVEIADETVFFRGARSVVHVAEMVFAFDVVFVLFDQLLFIGEFEEDGKEFEQFNDDEGVAFAAEGFDVGDVVLEYTRLRTIVEAVEFGQVVDLDIVAYILFEAVSSKALVRASHGSSGIKQLRSDDSLPQSSRPIPIILAPLQILQIMELQLLLKR